MAKRHVNLDTPAIFQSKMAEDTDFGGEEGIWQDVAYDVIAREPLRGTSAVQQEQLKEGVTERVTMRWRPGVSGDQRILIPNTDEILNIYGQPVNVDNEDQWIELMVKIADPSPVERAR